MQPDFLCELLDRTAELHRAVETCGYGSPENFSRLLSRSELVYFDLKLMDPEEHKRYTGVENALILENARTLMASGVPYIFRVPFIHGVNTGEENLRAMADFLRKADKPPNVEFLPYNTMAGAKYRMVGLTYGESFEPPLPEDIERAKTILKDLPIRFRK